MIFCLLIVEMATAVCITDCKGYAYPENVQLNIFQFLIIIPNVFYE